MRVFNEIMRSKRFDDLLDKMNTCTIFLLVICSSFVLAYLQADTNYFDLNSYQWIGNPIKNLFKSKDDEIEFDLIETDDKREENVIIFDAGSTGTRVHVFKFLIENDHSTDHLKDHSNQIDQSSQQTKQSSFNNDKLKRKKVTLLSENFKSISPGLSSYAQQPEQAAQSIEQLLEFANELVDYEARKNTSLNMIATAGLRLLPDEQSTSILDEIERLLKSMKKPYKLTDDSIRILDGNSEGIFSWVTINFLLKKLNSPKKSVAVLDLGGGSTQCTFSPILEDTFRQSPEHYLVKRKILGVDETLYTHSYLGFGLMATRKELLIETINKEKQYLLHHDNINLTHPCFQTGQTISWSYQYVTYTVTGIDGDCYKFVNNHFKRRNIVKRPPELKLREIYAISYYYDRMIDVGRIKPFIGQISVFDYYLAARQACGSTFFDKDRKTSTRRFRGQKHLENEIQFDVKNKDAFLCLDLTYIANLLNTGFGLQWRKKLTLGRKINNIEMSWALGSALSSVV